MALRQVGINVFSLTTFLLIYPISAAEIRDWKKYEEIWKDLFKLR